MPTRIIREGIITSEAVNRLSHGAENFYRRLMSIADDYGRYFAHPALLRSACYPLQVDKVTDTFIVKGIKECVDEGLITIYFSGKYLQITKFGQQTRGKSKFPEPIEDELLSKCISTDNHSLTEPRLGPTTNTTTSPTTNGGVQRGDSKPKGWHDLEEVKLIGAKAGLPAAEVEKFYNHYESNGWVVGMARTPMRSLPGAIGYWKSNYEERRHQNNGSNYSAPRRRTDGNEGTANEGLSHLYKDVGKLGGLQHPVRPAVDTAADGSGKPAP